MPQKTAVQRVGPLAGLPDLVAELGGDPGRVFTGTGFSAAAFGADLFIPLNLFIRLLERAATETGHDDFTVILGQRQTVASLGPIGRLMTYAPTLGDALADFVSFQISNSRAAAVYLHRIGEDFAFGIGIYDPEFRSSNHGYDLSIAIGCSIIRGLTDEKVEPAEILMIRREPLDAASYRQLAKCPVRFNQPQCCIILSARSMTHRLKTANPAARDRILKDLHDRLSDAPWGIAGQVRHAIRPQLLLGQCSLAEIARKIGLHPRTLERHLSQEGTTFDSLKDEVRFAVARDLLTLTSLPAGEIGASLGYGSHSAFVHAFRRWSSTTPIQWRRENDTSIPRRQDESKTLGC